MSKITIRSAASLAIAAVVLGLGGLTACGPTAKDSAPKTLQQAEQQSNDQADAVLTKITAEDIDKAVDAFEQKIGTSPAKITNLDLRSDGIAVQAIDPKAKDELNIWTYRDGSVEDQSTPVDYGGDTEALKQNLFGTDKINSAGIVKAIKGAPKASKLDDPKIRSVGIMRGFPATADLRIDIGAQSPRGTKTVRTDMSGKVVEVF